MRLRPEERARQEAFHRALAGVIPTIVLYRDISSPKWGGYREQARSLLGSFAHRNISVAMLVSAEVRDRQERVRAEFGKIRPLNIPAVVGIGPTQAEQHGRLLEAMAPFMTAEARGRIFVVTPDGEQARRLSSAGFVAVTRPGEAVHQLNREFLPGIPVRIDYHASVEEEKALSEAAAAWKGRFDVVRQEIPEGLRVFLQQLFANLMGLPFEQVPDRVNLDRLTADVELLLKA